MSELKIMTPAQMRKWLKRVEIHKDAIAKHRDALRELVTSIDGLDEMCSDAIDSLEYAIDRISEQL